MGRFVGVPGPVLVTSKINTALSCPARTLGKASHSCQEDAYAFLPPAHHAYRCALYACLPTSIQRASGDREMVDLRVWAAFTIMRVCGKSGYSRRKLHARKPLSQ